MAQRNDEAGDVKDDLATLRKDVDKLITDLGALANEEAADARRGVKGAADKARASAKSAARRAGEEASEIDEDVRGYIRERPLTACGAALGAGFLGALLLRR
jgi:ElaB/YqjD/DUF883 family membrane-anchored ribosome-binding protein